MNQPRHREHFAPQINPAELAEKIQRMHEVIENMAPCVTKAALQLGMKDLKEVAKCA